MGMYVSQLRSVPVGKYEYYAYLVDASFQAAHSQLVDRFFERFAKQSGVDAVIVRGPKDLSSQLFEFLQNHVPNDFGRLENFFHEITSLIISEGALQTTSKPVYVLPLLPGEVQAPEQAAEMLDALLASLLHAMRRHQVSEFVASLEAQRLVLSDIKGGMLIATLRCLNETLHLKPNIVGLGVNLNAVIERVLGSAQRSL